MNKFIQRIFILTGFLALAYVASAMAAEKPRPLFSSAEDVKFEFRGQDPMMLLGRDDSFVALVHREGTLNEAAEVLEAYQLKGAPAWLTKSSCQESTKKLLNMRPEFPLELQGTATFQSGSGIACEVIVSDEDPDARIRLVYILNIGPKSFALIAKFQREPSDSERLELQEFVQGLKNN